MHSTTVKTFAMPSPLAKVIQLGQPGWPDPEDSVGQAFGRIPKTKLSYWNTKGPAQAAYEGLRPKILNVLSEKQGPIPNSDFVWFSPYMIGTTPATSAPVIMFSSEQRSQRRTAVSHVRKSKLLKEHPGMRAGEWPEPPHIGRQVQMASSEVTSDGDLVDNELESILIESVFERGVVLAFQFSDRTVKATASVRAVEDCFLVPFHALTRSHASRHDTVAEGDPGSDSFDFGDGDENEDMSDRESCSDSLGSEELLHSSSTSTTGSDSDAESPTIAEHRHPSDSTPPHSPEEPTEPASSFPFSRPGDVPSRGKAGMACRIMSASLDYALCSPTDLDEGVKSVESARLPYFMSSTTTLADPDAEGSEVGVFTSHGYLSGTLVRQGTQVHFPNSHRYQEVYLADFDSPVLPGDCGAAVYDASATAIFGHIVTGSADPNQQTAFVVPAKDVHADINCHLGRMFSEEMYSSTTPPVTTEKALFDRRRGIEASTDIFTEILTRKLEKEKLNPSHKDVRPHPPDGLSIHSTSVPSGASSIRWSGTTRHQDEDLSGQLSGRTSSPKNEFPTRAPFSHMILTDSSSFMLGKYVIPASLPLPSSAYQRLPPPSPDHTAPEVLPSMKVPEAQLALNRQRPPQTSVDEVLRLLKNHRATKVPASITKAATKLKNRDIFFIIDNSTSMKSHWHHVERTTKALFAIARHLAPDGAELHFTDGEVYSQKNTPIVFSQKFAVHRPTNANGMYEMQRTLSAVFNDALNRAADDPSIAKGYRHRQQKGTSVFVLTDGAWDVDWAAGRKKCVVNAPFNRAKLESQSNTPLSVQFITFGTNDDVGTSRFEFLDSERGNASSDWDIVDTVAYDGGVERMLTGAREDNNADADDNSDASSVASFHFSSDDALDLTSDDGLDLGSVDGDDEK